MSNEIVVAVYGAALFLAAVIERLIEYFVAPFVPDKYRPGIKFVSLALGIVGAFVFGVDVITPTFQSMGADPPVAIAGSILTGIVIGGGSNLLHDLWPGSSARTKPIQFE